MKNSSSRSISRVTAVCLAAAVVAGIASLPGFAAEHVRVKVSPDAQVTYQRLKNAAALACGSANRLDLSQPAVWNRCYEITLQNAVDLVNEPTLVAIHQQHRAHATIGG